MPPLTADQPMTVVEAGDAPPSRSRATALGGVLLLLAPLQFLLFEQITAAAWRNPGYSFYYNFISDLGVMNGPIVYQGRDVDSPVGVLINLGFILLGLLTTTSILLLTRSIAGGAHRAMIRVFGILFGVGAVLVAFFPENSVELAHIIGAFLNIGFGNALLVAIGVSGRRYGLPLWLSRTVALLGLLGAVAMVALVVFPVLFTGVVERTAAYPYMFTCAALGVLALVNNRTNQTRTGR